MNVHFQKKEEPVMTPVAEVAKTFFKNTWELFLKVEVPGLGVSFAAFAIALFLRQHRTILQKVNQPAP